MLEFKKEMEVRWSDIDAHRHLKHTAYSAYAAHTRTSWMDSIGYSMQRMIEDGFGAVLLKEETEYYREVILGDIVTIDVIFLGQSKDAARWQFQNNIYKPSGKIAAKHIVHGAWIDLKIRKIATPKKEFLDKLNELPKSEDFKII